MAQISEEQKLQHLLMQTPDHSHAHTPRATPPSAQSAGSAGSADTNMQVAGTSSRMYAPNHNPNATPTVPRPQPRALPGSSRRGSTGSIPLASNRRPSTGTGTGVPHPKPKYKPSNAGSIRNYALGDT